MSHEGLTSASADSEGVPLAEGPTEAPPAASGDADDQRFLAHLRRAGELAGSRRWPEAELEILRSLETKARDLRALKLLALVRYKLGRLAEAREVFRTAVAVAPEDPGLRLDLGLLALKLEWFEDAIVELEWATRLRESDRRAWSYLGYAYARIGALARAAQAFRSAGQTELAAELERSRSGEIGRGPGALGGPTPRAEAAGGGAGVGAEALAPVTAFALARLLSPAEPGVSVSGGALHLGVQDETHVRERALLAVAGTLEVAPSQRRCQGRLTAERLGGQEAPFVCYRGVGGLYLAPPAGTGGLVALALDQDIFYVRERRVVAFDGELAWESGRLPWDPTPLLQFRGSGRVVLDAQGEDVVAVRVREGETLEVSPARLLGWLGRVVPRGTPGSSSALNRVTCDGEGVLLLAKSDAPPA